MNKSIHDDDENENESGIDLFEIERELVMKRYKRIKNNKKLRKYYNKRYQLFTRFDHGILLDRESWYSVTPERVAQHIALKCFNKLNLNENSIVLDAFSGCGGNTIQFAQYFKLVLALDIDFMKLSYAKHNSTIYNCTNNIQFICQDYFTFINNCVESKFRPDLIFISPPWGGVDYMKEDDDADLNKFPINGFKIFQEACKLTTNIVYFLPRNCSIEQIIQLAGNNNYVEIEQNFLDTKLVSISAYYGNLVNENNNNNNSSSSSS